MFYGEIEIISILKTYFNFSNTLLLDFLVPKLHDLSILV